MEAYWFCDNRTANNDAIIDVPENITTSIYSLLITILSIKIIIQEIQVKRESQTPYKIRKWFFCCLKYVLKTESISNNFDSEIIRPSWSYESNCL